MKILHVITRLDMGGSSRSVLQLASAQKARGNDVGIAYGMTVDNQDPSFFERTGMPGYYIPELSREFSAFRDTTALFKLWSLARSVKPDILHTHSFKAGFLGRIAGRLGGCRAIVHTTHGHILYDYFSPDKTQRYLKLERFAARFCDRVLPLTETERKDYLRVRLAPADKLTAVPAGIYHERFRQPSKTRQEVRESLGIPGDAAVVGWIGRLDPIKDCGTFISSYSFVEEKLPGTRYLIVGNGEERSSLLQRAEAIGVNKVIMTGRRTDIPDLLGAMDAIAMTALSEGLGRVLIEAMSVGVPIVATAVGGVPEILSGAGILVPVKDPQTLSEALVNILKHEKFRGELVEKGKARAEHYSVDTTVKALENIYSETLRSKGLG